MDDMLNPANPLSPFSPLNPLNPLHPLNPNGPFAPPLHPTPGHCVVPPPKQEGLSDTQAGLVVGMCVVMFTLMLLFVWDTLRRFK